MLTPFGEKTAWFAFRTTDVERVRGLVVSGVARPTDWAAGVDDSYRDDDGRVLVTPPIDGYVLAVSRAWLSWCVEGEMSTRASEWAGDTGWEVQYYANERVTGLYGWGRIDEDFEVRELLMRHGTIAVNEGAITAQERALAEAFGRDEQNANLLARAREQLERELADARTGLSGNAGTLVRGPLAGVSPDDLTTLAALLVGVGPDDVAGRWSVDPTRLDDRDPATVSPTCWSGEVLL